MTAGSYVRSVREEYSSDVSDALKEGEGEEEVFSGLRPLKEENTKTDLFSLEIPTLLCNITYIHFFPFCLTVNNLPHSRKQFPHSYSLACKIKEGLPSIISKVDCAYIFCANEDKDFLFDKISVARAYLPPFLRVAQ